jgi:thiaminase/transcriptional activator TenA
MREAVREEWDRAHVDHPTVRGIGDGTLSPERFRFYMAQDYLFLIDYCRVVALAAAKSPDPESMGRWAALLDETLNSEMGLHRSFCADFGISPAELEATAPSPATLAYTSHLLRVADGGSVAEIAAALLPCQWGYDEIGRALASGAAPEGSLHRRWIEGYNAPEYQAVTEWLRGFVDRLAADADDEMRDRMQELFAEGVRQEFAFWQAAWCR